MADWTWFDAALKELENSGNYTPPTDAELSQYRVNPYTPVQLPSLNLSSWTGLGIPSSAQAAPKPAGDPWWMTALNAIGGAGSAVTDSLYNVIDNPQSLVKMLANPMNLTNPFSAMSSLASYAKPSVNNAIKGQKEAWTDGNFNIADVPGIGAAAGVTKYGKHTSDILSDQLGWKQQEAGSPYSFLGTKGKLDLFDLVSLAGDIALDPTTYLTLGGASALKAGKAATQSAMKDIAEQAGIKIAKKETAESFAKKLYDNLAGTADSVGARTQAEAAQQTITNAGKAARNRAQNALFNIDVPFTDISMQLGSKPAALRVFDAKIGTIGASAVSKIMRQLDVPEGDVPQILQRIYGVSNPADLTKQMFNDLQQRVATGRRMTVDDIQPTMVRDTSQLFDGVIPATAQRVGQALPMELPGGLQQALPTPNIAGALPGDIPPALGGTVLENAGQGAGRAAQVRNVVDAAPDTSWLERNGGQFVQDMGGRSRLGAKLGNNPFNTRTLRSSDEFVNAAATTIRGADTKLYGQLRQMHGELSQVSRAAKGLTDEERKAVGYVLEDRFPGKQSADEYFQGMNRAQVEKVANTIRPILDRLGKQGIDSGTIQSLRRDYFPHVLKQDAARLKELAEKYKNDPAMMELIGRSSANTAGMQRKSFQNLAQIEDYMVKLADQMRELPEGAERAAIADKIDDLQNLFEREPVKVLGDYMYQQIRSSVMKDLQTQLEADGLLHIPGVSTGDGLRQASGDFRKLDAQEAAALNLPPGTSIHAEVYTGLKKMREIFTDAGANRALKTLDAATGLWKTLVTTVMPTHHMGNLFGNVLNNTMAGVGVSSYKQSADILTRLSKGTLTDAEKKLVQGAYDQGVIGHGFTADFTTFLDETGVAGWLQKATRKVSNAPGFKQMRQAGDASDNLTRLALYMHGIDSGSTAAQAGDLVRKYLFNYQELSNADAIVKRFIPFWTWTRNNMPLQLEKLFTTPRFAQTYLRIRNEAMGEDGESLPGWIQEGYIPGTMSWMRAPVADLGNIGNPMDMLQYLVGSANPFGKAPFELALNKQAFNGKPIEYGLQSGEHPSGKPLAEYLLKTFGGGASKVYDTTQGNRSVLELLTGNKIGAQP